VKGIHTVFDIYFEQQDYVLCRFYGSCVCNKRADRCYSGCQTHQKL